MSLTALNGAGHPVPACFHPLRIALGYIIIQPVGLNIGLVNHIKAIFVAQLIPPWLVGVMGISHGINIVLFHQKNILNHAFLRDMPSPLRFRLMAVNSLEHDWLTVNHDLSLVSPVIDNGNLPESHVAAGAFQN